MDGMVRVVALAMSVVVCAAVIRRGAPEMALLLVLAAGVWMLLLALDGLSQVLATMERLAGLAELSDSIVEPVGKTVVLAILTKVTGELCRSAGEGGAAAFVEVAGTALALAAALPLVEAVVQMMVEILG